MSNHRRRYERIELELPCRLFIPDKGDDLEGPLKFEAFLKTRNLGLGGVFIESTFLMKEQIELYVELELANATLTIPGHIAHVVDHGDPHYPSGLGIEFLEMDPSAREALMRDFSPPRYQTFFSSMLNELPHLEESFGLEDVSLILNLWEEWKVVTEGGPRATESGAPEPTPRRR